MEGERSKEGAVSWEEVYIGWDIVPREIALFHGIVCSLLTKSLWIGVTFSLTAIFTP
jgi:hypothetical protein